MRLLSYNIHKGIGGRDRRYRLARIIDVIAAQNPDILCLQEVDQGARRSRFDDQPALLAEAFFGAGNAYKMNVTLKQGGYGNLLLSRWPLLQSHDIDLQMGWRKKRSAQVVEIASPTGPLVVVNHHLGLAEHERHWQIRTLLDSAPMQALADRPTVVIGDFNDWRNKLHKGLLKEAHFSRVSAPPSRFRSFPAWLPAGSLDKAFIRGDITLIGAHIVRSQLAREASDHLPLVVDISVPG